jgi:hypothetical protein
MKEKKIKSKSTLNHNIKVMQNYCANWLNIADNISIGLSKAAAVKAVKMYS